MGTLNRGASRAELANFLRANGVEGIRGANTIAPIDCSRPIGLASEVYTGSNFLQLERDTVFTKSWICVGLASDLPNPGDVILTDVARGVCSIKEASSTTKPCPVFPI